MGTTLVKIFWSFQVVRFEFIGSKNNHGERLQISKSINLL